MNFLLPKVKRMDIDSGYLKQKSICYYTQDIDFRLKRIADKLPAARDGVELIINAGETNDESYSIKISENDILINSSGVNGTFYALQTLRQILTTWDRVPCLYIEDKPDFAYRGFYHDIARGKIPTVDTIKRLIDDMAYYKLNSLQLYVEYSFEFEETKSIIEKTGCITADEIKEIEGYAKENFIEFIPSIATFGHMYDILEQEQYKHLRLLKDHEKKANIWRERLLHHTIDPRMEESFELIKSLIDQYYPLFDSNIFNICGDETFDLKQCCGDDSGKLYADFICRLIDYLNQKGKKTMMWSDIILTHPEEIEKIPDDVYFLTWDYAAEVNEDNIAKLGELGRKQIVCPGTSSWRRFCENVDNAEVNIVRMIDYGKKYGAVGVLNTNWTDYGSPAGIELAMYGFVLGAAKSWNTDTVVDDELYNAVNVLLYKNQNGIHYLKKLCSIYDAIPDTMWQKLCVAYFDIKSGERITAEEISDDTIEFIQRGYKEIINALSHDKWQEDRFRKQMLLSAEGICISAELYAKINGVKVNRVTDTKHWLHEYRRMWLAENKESELDKIEEMLLFLENI